MVTIAKFHKKRLYLEKYLSYKAQNYIRIIRRVMLISTPKRKFALILSEKKLFKKTYFALAEYNITLLFSIAH